MLLNFRLPSRGPDGYLSVDVSLNSFCPRDLISKVIAF